MERVIKIEGAEIGLKVSAGTVRTYRELFNRDLITDMATVEDDIIKHKTMSTDSSRTAENLIWLMAKEYDPNIPDIKEWLDSFSPYFIFSAVVYVIGMWRENLVTLNKSKKKI